MTLAGCGDYTTPATNVSTSSATLNARASCNGGSSNPGGTPCQGYFQYGPVGGNYGNTTPVQDINGKYSNSPVSATVNLFPGTSIEYQWCSEGDTVTSYICVGPDGTPGTAEILTLSAQDGADGPDGIPGTWYLAFEDTFQERSLDPSKWTPQSGSAASDVSVSDGTLKLTYNNDGGPVISTAGNFTFQYGVVEALIYLPPASNGEEANHPDFATFGAPEANNPSLWPADGEIDVAEGLGGPVCATLHGSDGSPPHYEIPPSSGNVNPGMPNNVCPPGNWTGWHVFAADWEPGSVTYYYDGQEVGQVTEDSPSVPQYINLSNNWLQGDYTLVPGTIQVAYVRVWEH